MAPCISVIISVRNNERTIVQALRSIINQTFDDWEMLIADDGSTDSTPQMLREIAHSDSRIKVFLYSPSRGVGARCNQLIPLARGKYIARMDGDDISYQDRFAKQFAYLEAHPETDLLGAEQVVVDSDNNIVGFIPAPVGDVCREPYRGFVINQPTWMGKAEWFRRNPYREMPIEDYDLLYRSHFHSRFACLNEPLLAYREVATTKKRFLARKTMCKILLEHGKISHIIKGVPLQLSMMVLESFALRWRIRDVRSKPLPDSIVNRWQEVRRCL